MSDGNTPSSMPRLAGGTLFDKVLNVYKCIAMTAIALLLLASLSVLGGLSQRLDILQEQNKRVLSRLSDFGPNATPEDYGIPVHVTGGELEVSGEVDVGNWYMQR